MNASASFDSLADALCAVPVLDVHSHLCGARLAARGLHDILLYHMVVSDLYSAGCPSGARLTQFPGWATREEAHQRIKEALPYLGYIQNTSGWWGGFNQKARKNSADLRGLWRGRKRQGSRRSPILARVGMFMRAQWGEYDT